LSTAWLGSNGAARADNVSLQDLPEDPSLADQFHWSFFSHTGADVDETDLYGKWQWLSEDQEKLSYEADVLAPSTGYSRFVDWPKYENDINLWSCILDFRARKDGAAGIAAVLEGLMMRHNLRDMEGRVAERFWGKILAAAVEDENMLNNVWGYAEWLYHEHGVQWPNLYTTAMSSFVRRRLEREAMVWHVRLSPDFGLDTAAFLKFIKQYITVPDRLTQYILRCLYISSAHRGLYDELISHLFSQGCLSLANEWRRLLGDRNDGPTSHATRAFLRFQAACFPNMIMPRSELLAASLDGAEIRNHIRVTDLGNGTFRFKNVKMGRSQAQTQGEDENGIRYLINKVHGQTFGIEEKVYDDTLGARWFASSWVSIDSTINTVQMLGFNSIGPLSLQSIALREQKPDQILRRIRQLAAAGISITESSYTRAVRSFASTGDDALLESLLQSDMHPDVFDDITTQRKILDSVAVTGNWTQHELIMAVRLAVSQHVVATISNDLLGICLRRDKRAAVIDILDMNLRAVQVPEQSERTSDTIAHHILRNVSSHTWSEEHSKPRSVFHALMLRRLMSMQFPLPVSALRTVMLRLGRDGYFDELERLSMLLLQHYSDIRHSPQHHLVYFHKLDLPTLIQEGDDGSDNSSSNYQLVPHDLDLSHQLHPAVQLFNRKLQFGIVRWSFRRGYLPNLKMDRPHVVELMVPKHFHFARGIRVLAMLRDRGVAINRGIPDYVAIRIAELFWSGRLHPLYGKDMRRRGITTRQARTQFLLDEVYAACEEAWQTVPADGQAPPKPLLDRGALAKRVEEWGTKWLTERPEIFARRVQPKPKHTGTPMSKAETGTYLSRGKNQGHRWMFGHIPESR